MPLVKYKPAEPQSVKAALKQFHKEMGASSGSYGGHLYNGERVPTGIFPFDLATCGGFPRGRASIVYGPESSGKTNLALSALREHQRLWPDLTNVYIAIEPFDQKWAVKMGVNLHAGNFVVMYPSYAEEAVDMAEKFLKAEDCGMVVMDSLAAMITTSEESNTADKSQPGGPALVVGKLVRKTAHALRYQEKAERMPTLLYINQTRFKIGVMHGDPETMPGGNGPRFQSFLWVRVRGKNIIDNAVSDSLPVRKETHFKIIKNKVPILSASGMFEMAVADYGNLRVGECADATTVMENMKTIGMMQKSGKGWKIIDEQFPSQQAVADKLYADKEWAFNARNGVIDHMLKQQDKMFLQTGDIPEDADAEAGAESEGGEE